MKFTIINIKQGQLLTTTIVVVALLLFNSSDYNNLIYGHNSLEKQVLLFWH